MSVILLILIAIIIWLLIKIHDYKETNTKLSKQNAELTNRIKLLVGPSQPDSEGKTKSGNKYASIPPMPFNEEDAEDWKKYENEQSEVWAKYRKVQENQPNYDKQFGRSFDFPKYTDKYDTHTDFTLRELLLLIWWGKIKKVDLLLLKFLNILSSPTT